MKRIAIIVGILIAIMPFAFAAELGVNYYHESLYTLAWDQPHWPVSLSQASTDLDDMKYITNNVKFYAHPFSQNNINWVEDLGDLAKSKGMHSAVNFMVDDRQLTDGNWGEYSRRVIEACKQLNGHTDEILVGNEISLHSSWNAYQVKDRVIPLMNECDKYFNGLVTYEAFWYEKDAWKGYNDVIYFMQYEGFGNFKANVEEMDALFGSNARIGEWGEDIKDGNIERDDWWQKDEIERRWAVIQNTDTPVAYIFTYREPSWNGFGIVRPDGVKRPLWLLFGYDIFNDKPAEQPTTQPKDEPVQQPKEEPTPPVEEPASNDVSIGSLEAVCGGCDITKDVTQTTCREFDLSNGGAVKACLKGNEIEMYKLQNFKSEFCLAGVCFENSGFAKGVPTDNPDFSDNEPTQSSADVSCKGFSCNLVSDVSSGCRTVTYTDAKVLSCNKGDFREIYLQQSPGGDFEICVKGACVNQNSGFGKVRIGSSQTEPTTNPTPSKDITLETISISPASKIVGDYDEGSCRKIHIQDNGWTEVKICEKTNSFEIYRTAGSAYNKICAESACVDQSTGFQTLAK